MQDNKFIFNSINLSRATSEFKENQKFACLCSLIIENTKSLIINFQTEFLINCFNSESDIVTILNAIYQIIKSKPEDTETNGISESILSSIYSQFQKSFETNDVQATIIEAIDWSRQQPDGTLGMVDKFITFFNQTDLIENHVCNFVHISNTSSKESPDIVYELHDHSKVVLFQRPGWRSLETPGNAIFFNISEFEGKEKRGFLIHRYKESPGVVGFEAESYVNSIFFSALLTSYWKDEKMTNTVKEIYRTKEASKESAYLIHVTNVNYTTYVNYCPLSKECSEQVRKDILLACSLMPFVPRSILFEVSSIHSVVEIANKGESNYSALIHLPKEPDTDLPFAFELNKETLEYAASHLDELQLKFPKIRFAITGESLVHKQIRGDEKEPEFSYPDVLSTIGSVFDQNHPSHLVLLVDKKYEHKPKSQTLNWLHYSCMKEAETKQDDENMINVSYIPTKEESIKRTIEQIKDPENQNTCIFLCLNSKTVETQPLYIYTDHGACETKLICRSCLSEILKTEIHDYNTSVGCQKRMNSLDSFIVDVYSLCPCIPIGQLVWTMLSDYETFGSDLCSYFTILVENEIKINAEYFVSCPNHSDTLLRRTNEGETLKCPFCDLVFCEDCLNWHTPNDHLGEIRKCKRCPKCLQPVYNNTGNNIIKCQRCNTCWCYACDKSPIFGDISECYSHIKEFH